MFHFDLLDFKVIALNKINYKIYLIKTALKAKILSLDYLNKTIVI